MNQIKRTIEIDRMLSRWWGNQPETAKVSLFCAFIVGFFSHLFVYTGRYFGDHDVGMVLRWEPYVSSGRWLNTIINQLSFGYVIPYTSGIFVSLFIAISAFYICKLFYIQNNFNAFIIGALLATFPTVSVTNLFLYDSPNYHFGIPLAVIAVFITVKYRFGFLIGAFLLMCTLAIYQHNVNVAVILCLFILINELLITDFDYYKIKIFTLRFLLLGILGGTLYLISLPLSSHIFNIQLSGYKGMSTESMSDRLFSVSGLFNALKQTYHSFFHAFKHNFYFNSIIEIISMIYIFLTVVLLLFLVAIIIKQKIYKQPFRLFTLIFVLSLIPLAANFAIFFTDGGTRIDMVYAFVFILIFAIIISENIISESYNNIYLIVKQATKLCLVFLVAYYIMINNVYYLKAYYFNQRTIALTTRISTNIDPLIPKITSGQVGFFGGVPSEYYPEVRNVFPESGGYSLGSSSFLRIYENNDPIQEWHQWHFIANIGNLQGIHLDPLLDYNERNQIREVILSTNMPAWPAEGSVGIINDVIVINFGIADIVIEEIDGVQTLRARHWISEECSTQAYEYYWEVYQDDNLIDSQITNVPSLNINKYNLDDAYRFIVKIKNINVDFNYQPLSIESAVLR
ncbi:MAG: glucosyltransferase domain-containing protein [Lachnospiraceae bacterium]|nr:glucosyltransferase domain-containing protein [Lachnospiraceae bacterium]